MSLRIAVVIAASGLLAVACSTVDSDTSPAVTVAPSSLGTTAPGPPADTALVPPATTATARNQAGYAFPPAPATESGSTSPALANDIDALLTGIEISVNPDTIRSIGRQGDPRAAWLLADILRFVGPGEARQAIIGAFEDLTGALLAEDPIAPRSPWQSMTDHLIAWDLPSLDRYREWKGRLFTAIDPRWSPFFSDEDATIDYRWLGWGGVLIDDRPLGTAQPCVRGCIPALDDPVVTDASGGDWYPDDAIVFGVVVNGEARAYPKNIMEVHEMVNDSLGGRRLGIPYCTLCGSAQAYFTDGVPPGVEVPVLRTTGLLSRSNKVMYDLVTASVLDTFTGAAVSGPLLDAGIILEQAPVVTSTWGAWKADHPDTTVVAEDGGIGRIYDPDPLGGRDDNGPIFPIGDVDRRLAPQAKVLGVIVDGNAVAFDVETARAALAAGQRVEAAGVVVVADGSGVRAERDDGTPIGGHEAFWFAWSQFHPETDLWTAVP